MKSTQAMRDRIRELMPKAWDDYDRAVGCVLDDLEQTLARIEQLEAALREISIYDTNITKTIREALAPEQDK
jgi:hypothetical protein